MSLHIQKRKVDRLTDKGYCRPRIHQSQRAICFNCWQLIQVRDVNPKKVYIKEVKPADLMQNHCHKYFKARAQNENACLILNAYLYHYQNKFGRQSKIITFLRK